MNEYQKHALETLRQFSLQILLISAGVFGIVGGFVTASDKQFIDKSIMIWSLSSFALSALFGYLVQGCLVGQLNQGRFEPHNKLLQLCSLVQIALFLIGGGLFCWFVGLNI